MAKVVQLKKANIDVYPRTLDSAIVVSGGTKLLSTKLGEFDSTFSGITDGSIIVGNSYHSTYSDIATNAASAVNDADGNDISETYLKSADFSTITDSEINSLFQ